MPLRIGPPRTCNTCGCDLPNNFYRYCSEHKRAATYATHRRWVAAHRGYYRDESKKRMRTDKSRWTKFKRDCVERDLQCGLTFEQFVLISHQDCFYCGESYLDTTGSRLDRMDNDQGYLPDNVVACCFQCNGAKGNRFSAEEMKMAMEIILFMREIRQ